ncbi:alkyl sulfatase dimerization domain-containing protein [Mycolicibacter sp. MYC123]|uniref:Alkyl sulfatase dimerization domain-containing protein n=1 Tax=[Mycobacterium] zoologicum TaxID=2872311 RepID=A0ABU5YND4_9MYCO|nr:MULTISPECIES: alkyl sulfatase dimerization domain-containing protein [unclassified Mycolicibacter]MEB3051574.1 alkyl sulfatase dimerization domain-containing protein [Mycolicibacter sp. MYC123]MEB3061395.1 alkyl sulfatase dimerization domain-containing protein [Mycolicibacter sp. MYC101]
MTDFTRRAILGRFAAVGVTAAAASALTSACEGNQVGGSITTDNKVKPATEATKAANNKVRDSLPFNDRGDFEDAQRNLVARPDTLTITDADGKVVWDLESYKKFIADDKPAPDTVNPSLWRNAQLCMNYGLFKVVDRIYQVRGYDLSNITFIQGDTGWIVFDTLISPETAKAALDLVNQHLGEKPIVAVVHSHSHTDHYGGVRGIIAQQDVDSGKVKVIAPVNFVEDVVDENVIAGNAMSRRAVYMYGALLPRDPAGGVNAGLGQTISTGKPTLVIPTDIVSTTGTKLTVDGVEMVFQMTPGTEAPTEMNTFFPQFKAMWMAENTTNTMHNLLTLRGAQVRNPLIWAAFIDETIRLYGAQTEVKFQSHHWPMWGNAKIIDYFKRQRDLYKYTHDQSVRLMNQGLIGSEIAEEISLPPELNDFWPGRGYYGTLRHNSRAVYQRYMGWYDGNPSDLDDLPPADAATKYIEYMGGENAVLKRVKGDIDSGNYRWAAMVLKHVVFANPDSVAGKNLLADCYEQLGYQAESGPWRAEYLQGAYELRNGVPDVAATDTVSPDTIRAMPPEKLFDYLAVRLNGPKAAGKKITLNMKFTDLKSEYGLTVENGVLNYAPEPVAGADADLTLTKATLDDIELKNVSLDEAIATKKITIDGNRGAFDEFMGLLDTFPFWFNIVTP